MKVITADSKSHAPRRCDVLRPIRRGWIGVVNHAALSDDQAGLEQAALTMVRLEHVQIDPQMSAVKLRPIEGGFADRLYTHEKHQFHMLIPVMRAGWV